MNPNVENYDITTTNSDGSIDTLIKFKFRGFVKKDSRYVRRYVNVNNCF